MTQKSQPPAPTGADRKQPKTRKKVNEYKKALRSNPTTQSAMAVQSGTDL